MLNTIIIMGRLTRDPELRRTQNGTAVTSFTLAVDRDFKNPDGSRDTDFIDCVAWKGTAEMAAKYFAKGRMAAVKGRLQFRDWQDRDGNNRRSAEVIVDSVFFADNKPSGAVPASGGVNVAGPDFRELDDEESDGDLPF
jgi:single-strand DNA-binding protein